jgi:hypothetical protein
MAKGCARAQIRSTVIDFAPPAAAVEVLCFDQHVISRSTVASVQPDNASSIVDRMSGSHYQLQLASPYESGNKSQ